MQITFYKRLAVAGMLICSITSKGQRNDDSVLQDTIRSFARLAHGTVGAAYKLAGEPNYDGINTTTHLPMQSVYKFHLALCLLDKVDKGLLTLYQPIPMDTADWQPKTWSPLRDQYKIPPATLPLQELLRFVISNSDNIACDRLFRLAGGPGKVNDYIRSLGITDISIAATEAEMHRSWPVQYTNWTTPAAMVTLLDKFDAGKILSPASTQLLFKWMSESPLALKRLKALLPDVPIAHKSGSSDVSPEGIAAATNDVGIITLPDKRHLIVAVFVSDSKAAEDTREYVIARIAMQLYRVYDLDKH